jgi:hypothetical protein
MVSGYSTEQLRSVVYSRSIVSVGSLFLDSQQFPQFSDVQVSYIKFHSICISPLYFLIQACIMYCSVTGTCSEKCALKAISLLCEHHTV